MLEELNALIPTAGCGDLAAIFAWLSDRGFDLLKMDSVAQDEYSYDLRIPSPDGRHLSFDVS